MRISLVLSVLILVLSGCGVEIRSKEFSKKKVPLDNRRYLEEQQDQDLKINDQVAQTNYKFNDSENAIQQGRKFSYEERREVSSEGEYQQIIANPKNERKDVDRLYPMDLPENYDGNIRERKYRVYEEECIDCDTESFQYDEYDDYDDQYQPRRKKVKENYRAKPVKKKIVRKSKPQIITVRPKKRAPSNTRNQTAHNVVVPSVAPVHTDQSDQETPIVSEGKVPSPSASQLQHDNVARAPNLPLIPLPATSQPKANMPAPQIQPSDNSSSNDNQAVQQAIEQKALSDKVANVPQAGGGAVSSKVVTKSKPVSSQEVHVAVNISPKASNSQEEQPAGDVVKAPTSQAGENNKPAPSSSNNLPLVPPPLPN